MNTTINKLTNPNVRHTIRGIYLCEKLNKHLNWKKNFGSKFLVYYFFYLIIKYVCYSRIQQATGKETWGRITAII
jgi:hypothetical protein